MSRPELIERFSIERVNRSPAVFDREKLCWMNGVYMRQMGLDALTAATRAFFLEEGVAPEKVQVPFLRTIVALEMERARTLREMREHLDYFLAGAVAHYDAKGASKQFLTEHGPRRLALVREALAMAPDFAPATLEPRLRALAEAPGEKFGDYVHPLRLALTGRTASPGIFDVLSALGRETSLARIDRALEWIAAQPAPLGSEEKP